MAKKNGKLIIYTVLAILSIIGAYTAIVLAWGDQKTADVKLGQDIEYNKEAVSTLKENGCKPAQKHKTDIAVVENDIKAIRVDIGNIQTEQRAFRIESKESFKLLLEEINKK